MEDSGKKRPIDIIREMNPGVFIPTGQELADIIKNKEANEKMEEPKVFTPIQKSVIKIILVQVLTGRGKVVEDISQAINSMFPLTEQQIKDVDNVVESFVYGGGVQKELDVRERLQYGLDCIIQKLLQGK